MATPDPTEEDLYAAARLAGDAADFVFEDDFGSDPGNDAEDVAALGFEDDDNLSYDGIEDDLDNLVDFDDDDGPSKEKMSQKEKVEMIAMRRHLENIDEFTNKKQFSVDRTEEELRRCREKLQQLDEEQDNIHQQIANDPQNHVQTQRLEKALEKLAIEQKAEEDLEAKILETLDTAQVELAQANVEKGKFSLYREQLEFLETKLSKEKSLEARDRLRTENLLATNAEMKMRRTQTENIKMRKQSNERRLRAIESAKENRERAKSFLKETMQRMKQKSDLENEESRAYFNHRMKSILELKNDIQDTRENLIAQQLRDHAAAAEDNKKLDAEKTRLSSEGLNAEAIILANQRRQTFQSEERASKAAQRQREVQILSKIISEEENLEKRKAQQPWLWDSKKSTELKPVVRPKKKVLERSGVPVQSAVSPSSSPGPLDGTDFGQRRAISVDTSVTSLSGGNPAAGDQPVLEDEAEWNQIEDLAKPAFPGLWSGESGSSSKMDREKYTLNYGTQMEKDMMFRALEKQKAGIVQKQVAARREFKGVAYSAKPEVAHFKDLEIGKTYKKKIKLTNVSYSINYLKLIGMSEHLKDFIAVEFESPGQMSAGMTCDLFLTFTPMINENLEGTIDFLSQTGPFHVPVKCSVKRCELSLDVQQVDFGTEVVGQNLKKTVTLINKGALSTEFKFQRKPIGHRAQSSASSEPDLSSTASVTATGTKTAFGKETTIGTMEKTASFNPTTAGGATKREDTIGGDTLEKEPTMATVGEASKPETAVEQPSTGKVATISIKEPTFAEDPRGSMGGNLTDREARFSVSISEHPGVQSGVTTHRDAKTGDKGDLDEDELTKIDGMHTGTLREGIIGPFQQIKLEILYDPILPGNSHVEFEVSFTDKESRTLYMTAIGRAIDVPVWVERQSVPLEICMFDRLYQDSIIVRNRATIALGLKFEIDKRMKNHLELLPKTAYIQAQSSFSAQLKFLPRRTLLEDAGDIYDERTGVMEVPCWITVADQNEPVPFIVTAIVTNSDLEFDKASINFGYCSIYENVYSSIKLSNHSILPQSFGFVKIPPYVDIQPNDGFGTLLPEETITLDVIFSPKRADEYDFELTCKSGIDRNFKIKCQGIGVHPPLELSHSTINFAATAVGDQNIASIFVINSHTSRNEYTHPVPRIGRGEVAPVGPTSFEFCIPEGAPLEIWPVVGTIEPNSKQIIKVLYKPVVSKAAILNEAVRIAQKKDYEAALLEREEKYKELLTKLAEDAEKGKAKPKKAATDKRGTIAPNRDTPSADKEEPPPIENIPLRQLNEFKAEDFIVGSDTYLSARGSLLRTFEGEFQSFTIPCYVASGALKDPGDLEYSVYNTLYLEVHCPAVRPNALVISDCGSNEIDFGKVAIGQSIVKPTTLQNITDDSIDASATPLDPFGPFDLRNALLEIDPNATHTCLFSFTPTEAVVYHETINLTLGGESMLLTLKGIGVTPHVAISVKNDTLDCGHVLAGDSVPTTFTILNDSDLAVPFLITQDAKSLTLHEENQKVPYFLDEDKLEGLRVGPQNFYGDMVFDCSPWQGLIESGSSREITVMFSPDHPSQHFADVVRVSLFSMPYTAIQLKGVGCVHTTYVESPCPLSPALESLGVSMQPEVEEESSKAAAAPPIPLLLEMEAWHCDKEGKTYPARASLVVGSVKTSNAAQKKGGEYTFDNIAPLQAKGFNIDQPKGSMESGQQKSVEVVWTPPDDHDPNIPMEANVKLMVRGDASDTYNVMLRALVISSDEPPPSVVQVQQPQDESPDGPPAKAPDAKKPEPVVAPVEPSPPEQPVDPQPESQPAPLPETVVEESEPTE